VLGGGVEILDPDPFVADHLRALARPVLGRDADRTGVGAAALGLNATERDRDTIRRRAA
jgi:hypothetical protein